MVSGELLFERPKYVLTASNWESHVLSVGNLIQYMIYSRVNVSVSLPPVSISIGFVIGFTMVIIAAIASINILLSSSYHFFTENIMSYIHSD